MVAAGQAGDPVRGRRAFERAIARERASIAAHDNAAKLHEVAAARLEQMALKETDAGRSSDLVRLAAVERDRASRARSRARRVRDRLAAEGVRDTDAGHPIDEPR